MRIEEKDGNLTIVDFDEIEACKIARKIERDGIHFYEKMASGISSEEVRETIHFLLGEERKHLRYFEECLLELQKKTGDSFEEDSLLDDFDYSVFRSYEDIEGIGNMLEDPAKALKLGVLIEKSTMLFYDACRDNVTNQETVEELTKLIQEEGRHKELLENMLRDL